MFRAPWRRRISDSKHASKESFVPGTLVAFSTQRGSWTACAGFGSNHELMKGLTWGLLLLTKRLCTALLIDLYKATTMTNGYVLYIISDSLLSILKKGAIDVVSLPSIYVKKKPCMCSALSILLWIFLSILWTTIYNEFEASHNCRSLSEEKKKKTFLEEIIKSLKQLKTEQNSANRNWASKTCCIELTNWWSLSY